MQARVEDCCSPRTAQVLLLGLGNDILRDDSIGLRVARSLAHDFAGHSAVDVRETTEMGIALLDFLVGYTHAIIVDSIVTGLVPAGTVHLLDIDSIKRLTVHTPHFLGVGETVALGHHLGLPMPTNIRVMAVEVEDPYTLGEALTEPLNAAFPRILEQVRAELSKMADSCKEQPGQTVSVETPRRRD
ncbi:MAG: hydrogenase maturation protease [Verrucomicrobiia bacterium]